MRLTRAGEYAVRCIYHLAIQGVGVVAKHPHESTYKYTDQARNRWGFDAR